MADAIEILIDTGQIERYIEEKREKLTQSISITMNSVLRMMVDRVKANVSGVLLQAKDGKLAASVQQVDATQSGNEIVGSVSAGGDEAPYGIYFEKGGLGPYDITPLESFFNIAGLPGSGRLSPHSKEGAALDEGRLPHSLAFMMGGRMVFAKIVHHPSIPHIPWFEPEQVVAEADMKELMGIAFEEVLGE